MVVRSDNSRDVGFPFVQHCTFKDLATAPCPWTQNQRFNERLSFFWEFLSIWIAFFSRSRYLRIFTLDENVRSDQLSHLCRSFFVCRDVSVIFLKQYFIFSLPVRPRHRRRTVWLWGCTEESFSQGTWSGPITSLPSRKIHKRMT